jgi:hypothetical protein
VDCRRRGTGGLTSIAADQFQLVIKTAKPRDLTTPPTLLARPLGNSGGNICDLNGAHRRRNGGRRSDA